MPLLDKEGRAIAAVNVGAQAARASVQRMIDDFLPAMRNIQRQIVSLLP